MVKLKYTGQLSEIYADGVKFSKDEVKHVSDAAASAILKAFPSDFIDDSLPIIEEVVVVAEDAIEEIKSYNKGSRHGIFK